MAQEQSSGGHPLSASITSLLSGTEAKGLTPAAAKLTKRDLLILATGESTDATAHLTIRDLQSITHAFAPMRKQLASSSSPSCCCCSIFCCCCAASEPEPVVVS